MEKIQIICNPNAGRQIIQKNVPKLVELLESGKKSVDLTYTKGKFHAEDLGYESCSKGYDLIITVGGDGTVNEVVNGMMKSHTKSKLAIYPAGSVNDFGNYLKIPKNIEDFSKIIIKNNSIKVDVGASDQRYFLNVAAAGLLPEVAHKVSSEAKTVLGKFAYYMKGIKEFSKIMFKPINIKLYNDRCEEEKEILFFILANSPSVGGFKYVAPEAKVNDGHLDLLIVEHSDFKDVAGIFVKALTGSHAKHPALKYLQVQKFTIHSDEAIDLDLDGELAGSLPASFRVETQALDILIP